VLQDDAAAGELQGAASEALIELCSVGHADRAVRAPPRPAPTHTHASPDDHCDTILPPPAPPSHFRGSAHGHRAMCMQQTDSVPPRLSSRGDGPAAVARGRISSPHTPTVVLVRTPTAAQHSTRCTHPRRVIRGAAPRMGCVACRRCARLADGRSAAGRTWCGRCQSTANSTSSR
jgi:hypothetical protein